MPKTSKLFQNRKNCVIRFRRRELPKKILTMTPRSRLRMIKGYLGLYGLDRFKRVLLQRSTSCLVVRCKRMQQAVRRVQVHRPVHRQSTRVSKYQIVVSHLHRWVVLALRVLQVEEKFTRNFRVNREMRYEILVYESILLKFRTKF